MTYSDYYITPNRTAKIEILPSDFLDQRTDIVEPGDRLITVYRPVEDPFVAKRLHDQFWDEYSLRLKTDELSVTDTLKETIKAFNVSCLNPPSDFIPESGAMVLVAYLTPQVGAITLKVRKAGRFAAITQSHSKDGMPTHFIGHPSFCSVDESSVISSSPFVTTYQL
jgi:hypothetical protein